MKKRRMPKEYNLICKNCRHLREVHEDWVATGEYSPKIICPEAYEQGKFQWFEPMTNLEFLEWKDKEKDER